MSRLRLLLLLVLVPCTLAACFVAAPASARPTPRTALAIPAAPQLASVTQSSATIRWGASPGATAYVVTRGAQVVARVPAGTRSYTERGLQPASWYPYQVAAVRGSTRSGRTDIIPAVTSAATACTKYVSWSGSDAGDGSSGAPWRTVSQLVASWKPGWVGCLRGAFIEDVSIRIGGTKAEPVTLRSDPSTGARAYLTGRLWIAQGADHVRVAGLSLDGRANVGITRGDLPSPTVNGNDAVFIDNDVYNQRTRICFDIGSIRGYGTAVGTIVARNRIHDCGARDSAGNGNNHHHGIYVESGRATRIVQNAIFQNADRGIQLFPDAQGTLVLGNVLDGNGEGIIFSGGDGFVSSGNRAIGNVVTNSRTRFDIEYYWENPAQVGRANVVARNCVGGGKWGGIALPAKGYTVGANVTAAPSYVNRRAGDLRPRSGSACRSLLMNPMVPLRPFG
ncbi:MAG: right-handed parallel beta-helix repeat-containing protein [Thermoleophilia bacterium]|nr:right-handed parallel beta-helix repeat-containing protein [Thermoleophilia bacterium]